MSSIWSIAPKIDNSKIHKVVNYNTAKYLNRFQLLILDRM